jgi:hypothetical protein
VSGAKSSETMFNPVPSLDKAEKVRFDLVPQAVINFYDGKMDPYSTRIKDIKFKPSGGPSIKELNDILTKVTFDSFKGKLSLLVSPLLFFSLVTFTRFVFR